MAGAAASLMKGSARASCGRGNFKFWESSSVMTNESDFQKSYFFSFMLFILLFCVCISLINLRLEFSVGCSVACARGCVFVM